MSELEKKIDILKKKNYQYDFKRSIYVNKDDKKIISTEAIEDHDSDWLIEKTNEPNNDKKYIYIFNDEPDSDTKEAIEEELEK